MNTADNTLSKVFHSLEYDCCSSKLQALAAEAVANAITPVQVRISKEEERVNVSKYLKYNSDSAPAIVDQIYPWRTPEANVVYRY